MSRTLQPSGDKMKKVIHWVCEEMQEHPEKKRDVLYHEAEIRFDLSPLECEFLNTHFANEKKDRKC
ncbi:MAG: hypothetical protein V1706_07030 [Pseudomonadota bacterium]